MSTKDEKEGAHNPAHPDPAPYAYVLTRVTFSFDDVVMATADECSCVVYYQVKGLLVRRMLCSECNGDMRLCPPAAGAVQKRAKRWSKEMVACPMQVGGPGHIVEIGETSAKKSK
ncbi:hypothetical protein PInf_010937 [Phytophthora infestans]|nr:hypothetical protein PInf_010937 [Phytophthora infestans]